ncbi:hypothetical protein [Clostridium lundense]|uniref:hypothetical protein n=1 Tax=Clostridium lundense TaxID=319475 RepID=UPI00047F8524|nr:hypothetical protein [Clostridium lundense]
MKRCNSKMVLFLVICFLCVFSCSMAIAAEDNNIKQFDEKNITDVNKIWTVVFKDSIDTKSVSGNVHVKDLTGGLYMEVRVQQGNTDNSIIILPPKDGYVKGHSYEIYINKNVKSKKNINLKKDVLMKFNVKNEGESGSGSGSGSGNGSVSGYNAKINVIVGEAPFTMFKKITVGNVNLNEVKKFKVEDGEQIANIGTHVIVNTAKDTLKVYFYNDGDKVIGESTINVDKNNDSNVQIEKN